MNLNQLCTFNYPVYPDDPTKTIPTKTRNEDTTSILSSSSAASAMSNTKVPGTSTTQRISTSEDAYLQDDLTTKYPINKSVASSNIITMPTSCQDLKDMGHSLNGFYSVKSNGAKKKIDTIFCIFNNNQAIADTGASNINKNSHFFSKSNFNINIYCSFRAKDWIY